MRVLSVEAEDGLAMCADPDGRRETVAVDLVAPVGVDDLLLVHAGTALQRLGRAA